MKRLEALQVVDRVFADRPIVVTCGAPARELASLRRSASHLYLLDSMGLAGAVAAGIALAGRGPVAGVEGDGSLLMGLPLLVSLGALRPPGLTLVVLDNHEHASAGSVPTHAAAVDLAAVAEGAGLSVADADEPVGLGAALDAALDGRGPSVVIARIEGGNTPGVPLLLEDPAAIRAGFESFLAET